MKGMQKISMYFGTEYRAAKRAARKTPLTTAGFVRECIRVATPEVSRRYASGAQAAPTRKAKR